MYTNNISGETHSYIVLDNISDHMSVIVCLDLALKHPKKYEAYVRDTKNFEAELFLEELSKSLHLLGETKLPININEIKHRAGQRCFELLALIGSPQLSFQRYSQLNKHLGLTGKP